MRKLHQLGTSSVRYLTKVMYVIVEWCGNDAVVAAVVVFFELQKNEESHVIKTHPR